jgi:hypothetical protein
LEEAAIAQKKHKPEEIVEKLRQVNVFLSQARPVAEAMRPIGVGVDPVSWTPAEPASQPPCQYYRLHIASQPVLTISRMTT